MPPNPSPGGSTATVAARVSAWPFRGGGPRPHGRGYEHGNILPSPLDSASMWAPFCVAASLSQQVAGPGGVKAKTVTMYVPASRRQRGRVALGAGQFSRPSAAARHGAARLHLRPAPRGRCRPHRRHRQRHAQLMQQGQRPVGVGLFFPLATRPSSSHSRSPSPSRRSRWQDRFAAFKDIGGLIGTSVSSFFLLAIARRTFSCSPRSTARFAASRRAGVTMRRTSISSSRSAASSPNFPAALPADRQELAHVSARLSLRPRLRHSDGGRPCSASRRPRRRAGLPIWSILVFPALFTSGMALVDSTDSVLMLSAYGWAFVKPIRKLYYNMTITFVSVVGRAPHRRHRSARTHRRPAQIAGRVLGRRRLADRQLRACSGSSSSASSPRELDRLPSDLSLEPVRRHRGEHRSGRLIFSCRSTAQFKVSGYGNFHPAGGRAVLSSGAFATLRRLATARREPVPRAGALRAVQPAHPARAPAPARGRVAPDRLLLRTPVRCGSRAVADGRFALIPRDVHALPGFQLDNAQWADLALPIDLAFLVYSTPAKKMLALYPSPAGATESLLALDAWDQLVAANPVPRRDAAGRRGAAGQPRRRAAPLLPSRRSTSVSSWSA